jgi:hypothetical protein
LSLIVIFITLQHGLYLQNISIANLTIKNTYIKWNEKLNLSIESIDIKKTTKSTKKLDYQDISKYLKLTSRFFLLTESLVIEKLTYGNLTLTLKHNNKEKGFLVANSPTLHFNSHFQFKQHRFLFTIDKFSALNKQLQLHGKIIVNIQEKKIYSKIDLLVNNDANMTLYAIADKERLDYVIKSKKDIQHIHKLVALFHLPKEIKFWTSDAINASSLTLNRVNGFIQYNDLADAYRHVYVAATLNQLSYTYNPQLDAVHTKKTELEFLHGVLYIRPKKAYSYGMYLNKSWLKIDFTKPQEILTLHLLFDGMLNKDMLNILNTYHIKLPFLQHTGKIETNLTITVNLKTIQIDAKGDFFTKEANFDYLGLNIDINDTYMKLNNYDVNISSMKAHYKDMADADVSVHYDAKKAVGAITLNVTKLKLEKEEYLNTEKKPCRVIYKISPKGDTITVEKSRWSINGMPASLDALEIPFNLQKLQLTLPTTYFSIDNIADGFITGTANLKSQRADFNVDLLRFKYQGVKLTQSNTELKLHYDQSLSLKADDTIVLSVNGSEYTIDKPLLKLDREKLLLEHANLKISKYIKTEISADYNIKEKKADINLKNFILINPKSKQILYYKKSIDLTLIQKDKQLKIASTELQANFIVTNKKWLLNLNSIGTIARNSNFLRKYNITNGKASFYKKSDDKYTKFKGAIYYQYKLLTEQDKAVNKYNIEGYITKQQHIYFKVNKKVNIRVADDIKINLDNCGINTDALQKFVALLIKQTKKSQSKKDDLNIFLEAKNSYLYVGNNRYVIADTINLQYYNGVITAQLVYAKGKAGFRFENDIFHLYGQDFDDKFMEKLFSLSKFSGGSLDFSMSGKFDDYAGTFYIKDTTIHDYVVLNNILAFINTIPSLATFSLPGYNRKGLHIDNAYLKFHTKNHIFHISDIYLGSKEIKILGKGTASVRYNNVDLTLNLKTDLGSNLSKIPLVGYIIFDGQSISTSLKITGKLTDPKVETMLARDIAVAPLNIILRTLTLPYKIIKDIADINTSQGKK